MGAEAVLVPTITRVMHPQKDMEACPGQRWQAASLRPPPFALYPGSAKHLRGSGPQPCQPVAWQFKGHQGLPMGDTGYGLRDGLRSGSPRAGPKLTAAFGHMIQLLL